MAMASIEVTHDGGCLCGVVRYRVRGAPKWTAYCHCRSCRRATGAPVTAYAGFAADKFELTAAAPTRFASSKGVVRSFCARCGTPLTYEGERWPDEVHVLVGSLDEAEKFAPKGHAFRQEKLPWLHLK